MQFGFTLKPEHDLERTVALTRQAEDAGFDYGWLFDSHVLWREPYVLLTLMAQATERLRLGTCVTNPATREPSVTASALAVLDELCGGRMDLGIGRGDSARRVLGKPPTTMATLEEAITVIKALVEGRAIEYEGTELRLTWTGQLDAAGLGRRLRPDGPRDDRPRRRRRDPPARRPGPDPLVRRPGPRGRGRRRAAEGLGQGPGRRAGPRRRPRACAANGRAGSRRSSATTSSTSSTSTRARSCPESLTGYVRDRTGYDYLHHAEVGSSNAGFVGDEVTDRFCVLGSVDDHIAKLHELADAGVDQFNIYLMNGDEESVLEVYGREIIPALRDVPAAIA